MHTAQAVLPLLDCDCGISHAERQCRLAPTHALQVRNEIQRTKIEMANEVIDAGR